MDSNRLITLLTRKFAGEISLEELEELRNLWNKHPEGVYYEEFLKELWTKKTIDDENTDSFYEKHKSKYQAELRFDKITPTTYTDKTKFKLFNMRKVLVYSLIVFFSITCLGVFYFKENTVSQNTTFEVVAQKGVRKKLLLPDGTQVWLNANSKLSYNVFSKNTDSRMVNLEGEAYFDVAHDKKRPFIIKTNDISIKVLGTAFNVKAYPEDNKTETTLIRGSIELSINGRPKEKILLKPNEKVALTNNHSSKKINGENSNDITLTIGNLSKVNIGDHHYIKETSWIENKLIFKDETMDDLIPKLERWYNIRIKLEDEKIRTYKYTGNVDKENISQLLMAMQLIKPFKFKIKNDEITLY